MNEFPDFEELPIMSVWPYAAAVDYIMQDDGSNVFRGYKKIPKYAGKINKDPLPKLPARNSICPCGSGLKFKKCCYNKTEESNEQ